MTFFLGMMVGALAVIFVPHMWEKWGPKSKKQNPLRSRTLGRGGQ